MITNTSVEQKKILLHSCCAPCAAPSIERLLSSNRIPTIFFSNSNIYPEEEFHKRAEEVTALALIYDIPVIIDTYNHEAWLQAIAGYENEPEKGLRCGKCFLYNISRTAHAAEAMNLSFFTTTLPLSPHKNTQLIHSIGNAFSTFVPENFKKMDGFKRSIELSKRYNLYRQNYCGCEFSLAARNLHNK